ncbi:MAG: iron-sulfur cluster repair di-iron protein [Ignavibacteria bacterium]|mgnify:CR=1 FL=1|jgi:regulator of cell morphogenesis and NO signaling|nr:iron-sulfur cluster repair di-iron protein [Ignavibacteria bacterium]
MQIQKENKIGQVVSDNFRTAEVFETLGLDFCCGGKKTINDACLEKGLDPEGVISQLSAVEKNAAISQHFNNWEVSFLIDYIINNHHNYVTRSVSTIEHHLEKVITAHGVKHPQLIKIKTSFDAVKEELIAHMQKEEKMLFPYIINMKTAIQHSMKMNCASFGSVNNPIKVMENEHEEAGKRMAEISLLSNRYTPPENACNTFKVLYSELKEFEQDLHQHVHLENNILFPKAVEMEKELNAPSCSLS